MSVDSDVVVVVAVTVRRCGVVGGRRREQVAMSRGNRERCNRASGCRDDDISARDRWGC